MSRPILTELLADMLGEPVCDAVIPKVHRGGRPYIATPGRGRICRQESRQLGLRGDF
ncbi:MAG: hypothetical protein V8R75_05720 [Oscillospiraceae bacterium]